MDHVRPISEALRGGAIATCVNCIATRTGLFHRSRASCIVSRDYFLR